ncbi:MAG TPA: hypothetical protein VH234_00480 [Candidatus Saccharimonadales bacterium]|nr:hypothetical protein [Candidatus Saccharimonadales bacterium]
MENETNTPNNPDPQLPPSDPVVPSQLPQPGHSISPNAADLPTPHQPAEYVPQPPGPPPEPVAPVMPSKEELFQPTVPPGPAAQPITIVSGDGGIPLGPSDGSPPPPPGAAPAMFSADPPVTPAGKSGRWFKKPLILAPVIAVLLLGSASAYYFGYYTNSSVVLSQSLSNTGKGYSKLIDYFNQQSQVHYRGVVGQGSYTVKSGSTSTDGNFSFNSNGNNSDTNFDVGLGTTRVKAEIRTIKPSTSSTPDIYLKASGITGLGALTGSSQIDSAINQYDGKWIAVDHTLIDNLGSLSSLAATSDATTAKPPSGPNYPSEAQVMDELQAFGRVNQQYVFTTDKAKSVTVVLKKYGIETVNGHKAYHYTLGFNNDHVKQYLIAQHTALEASKLNNWIKQMNGEPAVDQSFKSMEDSAKNIKSSDTFDLWADVNTRLVYKIRVNDSSQKNPAANYVDIGLDYKGGSSYPFFISGQSKDSSSTGSGSLVITLNSQAHSVGVKANLTSTGSLPFNFNANLTFTPSNTVPTISAPAGAVPLSQVLDQLGLGSLVSGLQAGPPSSGP